MTEFTTEELDVEPAPSQQVDPQLYRYVVWILGAVVLIAMIGGQVLAFTGHDTPELNNSLGGVAVGALATMLVVSNKVTQ